MTATFFLLCKLLITGFALSLFTLAIWMIVRGCRICWTRDLHPWWRRHYGTIDGRTASAILAPGSGCRAARQLAAKYYLTTFGQRIAGLLIQIELSPKPAERTRLLADIKALLVSQGNPYIGKRLSQRLQLQLTRQAIREGQSLEQARPHLKGIAASVIFDSVVRIYHLTDPTS